MPRPVRGLGVLDAVALGTVGLWCVWLFISTVHAGQPPLDALPYFVPALVGVAGVATGRRMHDLPHWAPGALLLGVGLFYVLGAVSTVLPGKPPTGYMNANAAVGVQLIALTGLAALDYRSLPALARVPRLGWTIVAAGLAAVLVLVVNDSQAGWVVAAPVALVALVAVATRRGPWRWLTGVLAVSTWVAGAYALVWLARLPEWPALALRALSWVRQELWQTALALWATNPLTGGGAGSYAQANPMALDPDTSPAHSVVMQVASEFGWIGLGAFGLVLLAGLVLALRRSPAQGVLAAIAWTALFTHALVDHLYHFATVTFFATMVLGWAGSRRPVAEPVEAQKSSTSPSVSRQAEAGGGVWAIGRDVRIGPAPGTGSGTNPADGPVRRPIA